MPLLLEGIEAPYGYCPVCGEPGVGRERRPNGDDRCGRGHVYPSRSAVGQPGTKSERHLIPSSKLMRCYRTSSVPKNAPAPVVATQLRSIQRDMVRMRRHLMWEGQRAMAAMVRSYMEGKIEEVCRHMESRAAVIPGRKALEDDSASSPHAGDVHVGVNEQMWKQVLEEVFGAAASVELVTNYVPLAQSTAARAYERTCALIGEEKAADASATLLRRATSLGQQVTGINDTTKAQLEKIIFESIDAGETVVETARAIRAAIPEISAARIPTIARTEVGRAVDAGTKQAVKESSVVKTICVIGCQAVEKGIPTYNGRPTCNITDVPGYDSDKLEFHPNHTGCIVPETFFE